MPSPDPDRARIEELIAAAERVASRPLPPERPDWLPKAGFAAAVIGALLLGIVVAGNERGQGPTTATTTAGTTVVTFAPTSTAVVITFPPNSTVPPGSSTTTEPATTTTVPYEPVPMQPTRWVEYVGGTIRLQGDVPDQATADQLGAIWAAAFGAANVDVAYRVAPGAPLVEAEPLRAHDAVQFAPERADLTPEATAFLDLIARFLSQNPAVTLDIDGYTDSVGPDDANLALSQSRVDAIFMYLVAKGVAPERMKATGHGEADPAGDNATPEGQAANRRVEFTVHGLLG